MLFRVDQHKVQNKYFSDRINEIEFIILKKIRNIKSKNHKIN